MKPYNIFFRVSYGKICLECSVFTFGLQPPSSVSHLLGSWLRGRVLKDKKMILLGAAAMCWAIWLCRNDAVFCRKFPNSYLQIILRATYWARTWSLLSKEEEKYLLKNKCRELESLSLELFAKGGWNFRNRVTL